MAGTSNLYQIIEGKHHHLIYLSASELPQSVPEEFLEYAKNIILRPTNLVINCFISNYIPLTWTGIFSILNSQLSEVQKKLQLIYVSAELINNCPHTDFNSFSQKKNLKEAIDVIEEVVATTEITAENASPGEGGIPTSSQQSKNGKFIRYFINAIINTIFIQASTPLIRQKIYIKKDPEQIRKFVGEMAGIVLVQSEEFFYYLAISCKKDTYLRIISSMLKEIHTEIDENNMNGLAEIVNIVLGQVKKQYTQNTPISYSIPQVHTNQEVPNLTVNFKGTKYTAYTGGETIVIPFQSNKGELMVEIWYLKEFDSYLLK